MFSPRNSIIAGLVIAGVAAVSSLAVAASASAGNPVPPPANAQVQPSSGYVGESTCLSCHDDRSYKGTLHARVADENTPAAKHGCESCHGAGAAHAESGDITKIKNPSKLLGQEVSEICTSCHNRSTHALWTGSQHDQRNVGCATCHSVHNPVGDKQIKAETQLALCSTCHRNVTNKQFRFNHMPVREGKVECTSCHNPHGSANVKLLKVGTTVDDSCTSCHSDKRGPHLWEHAPVSNSCVTCHDPHGSNNERLLVSKAPYLCQRCHVTSRHPPTVYDGFVLNTSSGANRILGRGCVNCHQQIHGSNAPSGQFFLR